MLLICIGEGISLPRLPRILDGWRSGHVTEEYWNKITGLRKEARESILISSPLFLPAGER
jgi:hypothetical protein